MAAEIGYFFGKINTEFYSFHTVTGMSLQV